LYESVKLLRKEVTAFVITILGWSDEAGSCQMGCGCEKEKWTTRRLREERHLHETHQPFHFEERMRVFAGISVSIAKRSNVRLAKVDRMESAGVKRALREE
jgi:hypothetical protein